MATTNHVKGWDRRAHGPRILASIGEPSLDTSSPKRPGALALSSFVFLDKTGKRCILSYLSQAMPLFVSLCPAPLLIAFLCRISIQFCEFGAP